MSVNAKDILWKGIIEDLFADFLRFFYKDADDVFDIPKGFSFLDKELGELYQAVDIRHPKFVDKLVKVHRKDGTEQWLLIHIEVQGYKDKLFARRMFTYFYRILDRFEMEVTSLAIFTDNDVNYCPDRYEYNSLDTSNTFRFKTYKIKGQDKMVLENSNNPFAIVVLTVLIALDGAKCLPEEMLILTVDLARRLLRKGFSRMQINRLLHFLSAYVYFDNQEMFFNFEGEISKFVSKEKPMGITELATMLIEENGMKIKQEAIISNLLRKSNLSIQEIADYTETTIDHVIEIKNKLVAAEVRG